MKPIREILVPVDFSGCSRAALDHAAPLANRLGASIDLLHVWEVPVFAALGEYPVPIVADVELVDMVRRQAEQQLESFTADARARGVRVRAARCEAGHPAQRIVDVAAEGNYDLIVMGTHGRTGLRHLLIGSVAERVARFARCPALTVRCPAPRAE